MRIELVEGGASIKIFVAEQPGPLASDSWANPNPDKVNALAHSEAKPLIVDAPDRDAIVAAVIGERPDVVHQLTAIPARFNLRKFDRRVASRRV